LPIKRGVADLDDVFLELSVLGDDLAAAAHEWRDERGMTWLETAPKIRVFPHGRREISQPECSPVTVDVGTQPSGPARNKKRPNNLMRWLSTALYVDDRNIRECLPPFGYAHFPEHQ
jgi:hypothetical protein